MKSRGSDLTVEPGVWRRGLGIIFRTHHQQSSDSSRLSTCDHLVDGAASLRFIGVVVNEINIICSVILRVTAVV